MKPHMRRNCVRTFAGIALVVFVSASAAFAQIPTSGNIFVGYSYSGGDVFSTNCSPACPPVIGAFVPASHSVGSNGWEGSLEGKFLPWIGVVIDVSRHYGSHSFDFLCVLPAGSPQCPASPQKIDSTLSTYLIGPRVSVPIKRFTPFAHLLFGAGHVKDSGAASNSDTSLATAVGGGIDYRLIHGIAWRVQGDEIHTRFFGGGQDHFRFSTGIDFRF
jgi:hypothetical protein